MKRRYSHKYMCEAYEYWKARLLAESLSPDREAGLKKAAKKFAKWFGSKIKSGEAQRGEDGNFDALLAIKKTIKVNSSEAAFKSTLKNDPTCPLPKAVIDQIAPVAVQKFCEEVFDGDSKCLTDLGKSIDLVNLKKSTPEFNYFANEVFQIWRQDPQIRATMGRTPDLMEPALTNQAAAANADADAQTDDGEDLQEKDEDENTKKEAPVEDTPEYDDADDPMMNESIRMTRRMARW